MPDNDNTIFTDEELEDIDEAINLGVIACIGFGGGPTCAVVGGATSDFIHALDWLYDNMPDSWKAEGVYDWQIPYDTLFKNYCEMHERAVQSVDAVWDQMRSQKGLPPSPSLAAAFLNDWLSRNGWRDGGVKKFKASNGWRELRLAPEEGPWAIHLPLHSMPARRNDSDIETYVRAINSLMQDKRLSVLEAAIKATMQFVALSMSGAQWKADPGLIREACWVHGTAVKCERPGELASTAVMGWGSVFQSAVGHHQWFHLNLPTPALVDGTRPVAGKLFVLYEAVGCWIDTLHLYDGGNRFREIACRDCTGDQLRQLANENSWLLYPFPIIQSGLGLSIHVRFDRPPPPQSGLAHPQMTFAAAGVDFNRST